jgi:mycothiol synthase
MSIGIRPLRLADEPALRRVMQASLEFDAFPGYDSWELECEVVSMIGAPDGVALALDGGVVRGYVSPRHEDLTVHPEYRRRGIGRRLFAVGLGLAAKQGLDEIRLCVPSTGPAEQFARAMGLAYSSSMWRLDLAPSVVVPAPAFPTGVVTRPPGAWLPIRQQVDLVNAAFADHPTPLSWTVAEIEHAQAQPGFDPSTSLFVSLAARRSEPIAFVRTSMAPPQGDDPCPFGEIRLIGVLPEWRGRGLGRELLRWGVANLRARGAGRIMLSVEAMNELALGLYRRTGFEPVVEWPHWTCPVPAGRPASPMPAR